MKVKDRGGEAGAGEEVVDVMAKGWRRRRVEDEGEEERKAGVLEMEEEETARQ